MSLSSVTAALSSIVIAVGMVPGKVDEGRFLQYLDDHGYSARYVNGQTIPRATTIMYGHMVCKNLHVHGDPGQSTVPQFPLIVEAAQHALCPDTLGGGPAVPS